jgi:MtrB/PioB family decaheme-associated outer membrane protein
MNKKLLAVLIANLFVAAPALAQSDDFVLGGSVSLGAIRSGDGNAVDTAKMNEYRDLSNGVLVGFDLLGRGNRYWLDAFGENLGRDDMFARGRGGIYDVFRYNIYVNSVRHNFMSNGLTPYAGAGGPVQTATFPRLDVATWNGLDVSYRRRDFGGALELQALNPWYFRAEANEVTSKGSKPGSASQGLSPGNGFVELAFPVEYKTKNTMLEAGYNTKTIHAALNWTASKFDNDRDFFTWTNGFWSNGTDASWLSADNKYSRLAGNLTLRRLPLGSTLAIRATKDELESNVALAQTVLHTGGVIAATGADRDMFNGKIENETFTVALASSPMRALDTRIYYNSYERNDKSPHMEFNSALGVFGNEPYSYDKKNWGIDAHFRLGRGHRIGAGYDYTDTERTRFDFDATEEKRYFVEYKNSMLDSLSARVKFQRLERESNFLLGNEGANANDSNFVERFLKAYDLSNVDQDSLKVTLDFSPVDRIDLSLEAVARKNDYRDMALGRLTDDRREIYASASYLAPNGMRFTLFGDIEEIEYESRHRVIGTGTAPGAYDPSTPATATNYNWEGKVKDRNWAFGAAVEAAVSPRLKLTASAMVYKTDGSVDFASQQAITSATYPVNMAAYDDTKRTSFNLRATFAATKAVTLTAGYAYEKYEYSDALFDDYRYTVPGTGTTVVTATSYLNGYYRDPYYKANIVYALVTYRF